MKQFLPLWLGIIFSIAIIGCISSEESGSDQQPVSQQTPSAGQQPAKQASPKSAQTQKKQAKPRSSRLTSKQDTLVASVTKKSRPAPRPSHVGRPKNPSYTVQVGVFRKAQNALRYQKLAKERFPKNSVHNRYDTRSRMYWVSIGKFTTKEEAVALRKEIMKKYPEGYKEAWVNYIPR